MSRPKYIRFSKFSSEKGIVQKGEAERLMQLRKEVRRLKRQRLIVVGGACLSTAVIVYLVLR